MGGWIKLYRQLQDCWIWKIDEPFDKRSAWIDLLMSANHSDHKILFNGELVTIKRGQVMTSIRKLAERWKWSYDKCLRYLKLLEADGMLLKESDKNRTRLTIAKYEFFQDVPNTDNGTVRTPVSEQSEHPQVNVPNTDNGTGRTPISDKQEYKECKELKNDKNEKESNITVFDNTVCQTETVQRVVKAWNGLETYGINPVSRISSSSKRYKSLVARLNEYGIENVLKAIENIKGSDYCRGKNRHKWVVTFDWFVLPGNFPKVLEGNYNNRGSPEQSGWDSNAVYERFLKRQEGKDDEHQGVF